MVRSTYIQSKLCTLILDNVAGRTPSVNTLRNRLIRTVKYLHPSIGAHHPIRILGRSWDLGYCVLSLLVTALIRSLARVAGGARSERPRVGLMIVEEPS
jgi:hypothetical protein